MKTTKTTEYIILNYGFENFKDFIDTLEHWEREWENNLFFENAIDVVKELAWKNDKEWTKYYENIKKAFEVWRLVQLYRQTNSQFWEWVDKKLILIQQKLWDIVEDNQDLEELIPKDISRL